MEPDYIRHAQEVIDRLRQRRPAPGANTTSAAQPTQLIITAPTGCVFYFHSGAAQPMDPAAPKPANPTN